MGIQENKIKELEQDIVYLKKANEGIRHSLDEMSALQNMLKGIASLKDNSEIIKEFISIIRSFFQCSGYIYYRLSQEDLSFVSSYNDLIDDAYVQNLYDINESILTWILNEKQISTISASKEENKNSCLLAVPFLTVGQLLGVMLVQINSRADDLLTLQTREILQLAAGQASIAIENVILYENLREQNSDLEKMKKFTTNILESLINGVITFNGKREITHLNHNASVMFGISDINAVGRHYQQVLPKSLAEMVRILIEQTERDGFVMDYQMEFELPGGVTIPYGLSTSLLRDENEELSGITLIARDMTASRELQRLRDLDKLKDDFVSMVSHDLRSPLATIRAYIDTLVNRVDPEDVDSRTMFLKTIEDETHRLSSLVENMLDIASIESGKIQLECKHMHLDEIVNNVAKLCQMQTQIHTIVPDIALGLPKVNIDKDRMTQVIYNLVNNAVKYSPNGGEIRVKVFEKESSIRVAISDQGMGMKPDDMSRLFQKFYRINNAQTSNIGGTGLGLAIVQKLVALHGGKIEVDSVLSKGSTFTVILPVGGV
ncbi:MAG: PAS domain S-box protein [Candidatus Aureabacteria bacterium]|nr:PAS domain S-box protein [Candidatus Auribacterota bacterium]